MKLRDLIMFSLTLAGAFHSPLLSNDEKLCFNQEDLSQLPLHQILKIWKQHVGTQNALTERSAASFARFCSSLGMTIRPVARHGVECYDIYYGRQWYFVDPVTLNLFLDLNNETFVSSETLMDDPFLFLRAYESNLHQGYDQLARFHIIHSYTEDEIPPNPERMAPEELTLRKESVAELLTAQFDPTLPGFHLESAGSPELLCWQVSSDSDFNHLQIERNQVFEPVVQFTRLLETFFNPNQTYHFRYKIKENGSWTGWSASIDFTLEKPQAVEYFKFDKIAERSYRISWKAPSDDEVEYLVFGSNALDFIPSIYTSKQANKLLNATVVEEEDVDNLLTITSEHSIIVDDSLAYFRIIARKNGRLSTPSPVIHVYDHELDQHRTVIQLIDRNGSDFVSERRELMGYSALSKTTDYPYNPYVTKDVWNYVKPFFLPVNHPIKSKLDRMFSKRRVTQSPATFRKAGFRRYQPGRVSHIMASANPLLEGYFIKAFSDEEKGICDWQKLTHRIIGARSIKKYILENGYDEEFSVPEKWIYPLPEEPSPPNTSKYERKNFILVCQDMRILSHDANEEKYRKAMTPKLLDGLYCIIRDEGLNDSVYCFNVPFCKDGRLSFIDTERHHYKGVIHYEKMMRYFSNEMKAYWRKLIIHGGPSNEEP